MSMISLMVGLLLSIIGAVSLLSLYRSIVGQTVQSRQRATQDGSFATATLTAQMELQNAGYGIGNSSTRAAANTDLAILSGAAWGSDGRITGSTQTIATGATSSGNAIIWGSQPSTTYNCNALLVQNAGMVLLSAVGTCTTASQWSALTWIQAAELIPAGGIGTVVSPVFRVDKTLCWPYGVSSMSALKVTLWDDTSVWKTSACLTNLAGA